jgi:hypothetical protein
MVYFFIFLGAVLRVVPHMPNFAPIGALALFGGVYLSRKNAFFIPLLAMLASDYFIGFDSVMMRVIVYGCFLLSVGIGALVKKRKNIFSVLGGTLAGSIIFYLVTNFAWFYGTSMYTHDLNGIITSYINALPFFRSTLMGDFFYVGVFFGSYELVKIISKRQALNPK